MLFVLTHSVVSDSLQPPWTVAHQAPLSMGFFREEILGWVAMSFSRGLPDTGIEPKVF